MMMMMLIIMSICYRHGTRPFDQTTKHQTTKHHTKCNHGSMNMFHFNWFLWFVLDFTVAVCCCCFISFDDVHTNRAQSFWLWHNDDVHGQWISLRINIFAIHLAALVNLLTSICQIIFEFNSNDDVKELTSFDMIHFSSGFGLILPRPSESNRIEQQRYYHQKYNNQSPRNGSCMRSWEFETP